MWSVHECFVEGQSVSMKKPKMEKWKMAFKNGIRLEDGKTVTVRERGIEVVLMVTCGNGVLT